MCHCPNILFRKYNSNVLNGVSSFLVFIVTYFKNKLQQTWKQIVGLSSVGPRWLRSDCKGRRDLWVPERELPCHEPIACGKLATSQMKPELGFIYHCSSLPMNWRHGPPNVFFLSFPFHWCLWLCMATDHLSTSTISDPTPLPSSLDLLQFCPRAVA